MDLLRIIVVLLLPLVFTMIGIAFIRDGIEILGWSMTVIGFIALALESKILYDLSKFKM